MPAGLVCSVFVPSAFALVLFAYFVFSLCCIRGRSGRFLAASGAGGALFQASTLPALSGLFSLPSWLPSLFVPLVWFYC